MKAVLRSTACRCSRRFYPCSPKWFHLNRNTTFGQRSTVAAVKFTVQPLMRTGTTAGPRDGMPRMRCGAAEDGAALHRGAVGAKRQARRPVLMVQTCIAQRCFQVGWCVHTRHTAFKIQDGRVCRRITFMARRGTQHNSTNCGILHTARHMACAWHPRAMNHTLQHVPRIIQRDARHAAYTVTRDKQHVIVGCARTCDREATAS